MHRSRHGRRVDYC